MVIFKNLFQKHHENIITSNQFNIVLCPTLDFGTIAIGRKDSGGIDVGFALVKCLDLAIVTASPREKPQMPQLPQRCC